MAAHLGLSIAIAAAFLLALSAYGRTPRPIEAHADAVVRQAWEPPAAVAPSSETREEADQDDERRTVGGGARHAEAHRVRVVAIERHGEVDRQQLLVDAERVVEDAEAVADVVEDASARERVGRRSVPIAATSANSVPAKPRTVVKCSRFQSRPGHSSRRAARGGRRRATAPAARRRRSRAARAARRRSASCDEQPDVAEGGAAFGRPRPARDRAPARTGAAPRRRPPTCDSRSPASSAVSV